MNNECGFHIIGFQYSSYRDILNIYSPLPARIDVVGSEIFMPPDINNTEAIRFGYCDIKIVLEVGNKLFVLSELTLL